MAGRTFLRVVSAGALLAAVVLTRPCLGVAPEEDPEINAARNKLIENDIIGAGVKDKRVIEAVRTTPRHEFVPNDLRKNSYIDMSLPIGQSQTISAPFIVAYMTEQIEPKPTDKVLEIGTGSGYQAAILSPLVDTVYTIEIKEPLGKKAAAVLRRLKYKNVVTKIGDGYQGWAEHAPFDKIIVTCSPENVPKPLVEQLKEGGRMVIPLGERYQQTLYLYRKQDGKLVSEALRPTLFVPMTGKAEDARGVLPDPLHPAILNGGFEEKPKANNEPAGWFWLRQAEVNGEKPGKNSRSIEFSNLTMGRGAQALQAFAIDGRKVRELNLSAMVRAQGIKLPPAAEQMPMVAITFYDEKRGNVGVRGLGPFQGTFDWKTEKERIKVPPQAREAIMAIGLLGATGELWLDEIDVSVASGK
ncbi:MAG TPA: protein-L-isoaspartate(D-aspartate) O-methyltransferase [Pirellulales bacterium]|jgi:protein-L-isoaspartate(D-aspartate) O-methyltransferase